MLVVQLTDMPQLQSELASNSYPLFQRIAFGLIGAASSRKLLLPTQDL